jgi:hypothetical protein
MSFSRFVVPLAITMSGFLVAAACSDISAAAPTPTGMMAAVTQPPTWQNDLNISEVETTQTISIPAIISVTFPEMILSDIEYGNGAVVFTDNDGDIHSAQFTLLEGGCMEFEYFAFDPMQAIQAGDRFDGVFQFRQMCQKCDGSEGDMLLMQVQLFDRASNASKPAFYQFICQ